MQAELSSARSGRSVGSLELVTSQESHSGSQELSEDLTWGIDGEYFDTGPQPWEDPSSPGVPSLNFMTFRHFDCI